jgi:hypothetical protein
MAKPPGIKALCRSARPIILWALKFFFRFNKIMKKKLDKPREVRHTAPRWLND